MSENKQLSLIDQLQPTEKSLLEAVNKYKNHLLKRASDTIRNATTEKQNQFLMRTVASIVQNDNLKECFNSPEGRYSVFELIDSCLKTGLELDKHAYAVPYGKKVKRGNNDTWIKTASFQVKDRGYHALLCGGKKRIFKDLRWGIVYENEKNNIKINRATGEVDHPICVDSDRGKPVGVWVQCRKLDDIKEVEFYPKSYIENIRNNHSKIYQDYISKKINSCVWITDEIPMWIKTAIKSFCRPFADVCEALQSAYYSEGDDIIEKTINVEDVAHTILDNAIEKFDQEVEKEKPEKPIEIKKDNNNLF